MTETPRSPQAETSPTIKEKPKPQNSREPNTKGTFDALRTIGNAERTLKFLAGMALHAPADPQPTTRNKFSKVEQVGFNVLGNELPNPGYPTEVTTYGGFFVSLDDGTMVYDTRVTPSSLSGAPRAFSNLTSQVGDKYLRSFDDHVARNPVALLKRSLKMPPIHSPADAVKAVDITLRRFSETLQTLSTPKRKRSVKFIPANIKRLGLEEYYAPHAWGIEIKKPEIFTKGFCLHDILRSDVIQTKAPDSKAYLLDGIDRNDAIAQAGEYVRKIHDQYGPIGEVHTADIQFQKREGNRVLDPVLHIPDMNYVHTSPNTPTRQITEKATDMLDFMAIVGSEVYRRARDEGENPNETMRESLGILARSYGDSQVLDTIEMFVRRGRLVLPGDKSSYENENWKTPYGKDSLLGKFTRKIAGKAHNAFRLGITDSTYSSDLKQSIIEACEEFKKPQEQL